MNTQTIISQNAAAFNPASVELHARPAYIEDAITELLTQFPAWCDQFEHRIRIERAEGIAKNGGICSLGDNRYAVPSAKNNGEPYIVDRSVGTCSCPDYRKNIFDTSRTGWKCKHRIAAYLVIRALELEEQDHLAHNLDAHMPVMPLEETAAERHAYEVAANAQAQADAAATGKAKRKSRARKTKTVVLPEAPQETPRGTWDIAITGEIVHVCADGYNAAPIMGVGADLWCHRCNEPIPHVLMTRESRLIYNHVAHIADDEDSDA